MVAGVAAGIGRYFDVDPVIVRIAFIVLSVFGGSGVLLYMSGSIRSLANSPSTKKAIRTPASRRLR